MASGIANTMLTASVAPKFAWLGAIALCKFRLANNQRGLNLTPSDLRTARKRLGLSQHGLAEALRMGKHGHQTVSAWERDDNARGVPGPVQIAVEGMLVKQPPEKTS